MTADSRIEAVADALLDLPGDWDEGYTVGEVARVAVAALDAYDLDRETPEGGRKAAAVARAVLAERERIAQEIEAAVDTVYRDHRAPAFDRMPEGEGNAARWALRQAACIVRGRS